MPRRSDFKLGCIHGKLVPNVRSEEAWVRNQLYLIGSLVVEQANIKLVAYEMPLSDSQARDSCIDLFGYDQNRKPWIIELKKGNSTEHGENIMGQLTGYDQKFQTIRPYVENEIRSVFHWPEFRFSKGTGLMLLAQKCFYEGSNRDLGLYSSRDIVCCSFRENQTEILEKNQAGRISLAIENSPNT